MTYNSTKNSAVTSLCFSADSSYIIVGILQD